MSLVALLPEEVAALLEGASSSGATTEEDAPFLRLVAEGLSSKEIAARTGIGVRAVERRIARLCQRHGVRSRSELVAVLANRGF